MQKHLLAGALLAVNIWAPFPSHAQQSNQEACPAGQERDADGNCASPMPATPHQQGVLKEDPATAPQDPASTGQSGGAVPATPHQQQTLQPKPGG
jgi:predicted lipid-binding transport protein (Tim44 family)